MFSSDVPETHTASLRGHQDNLSFGLLISSLTLEKEEAVHKLFFSAYTQEIKQKQVVMPNVVHLLGFAFFAFGDDFIVGSSPTLWILIICRFSFIVNVH